MPVETRRLMFGLAISPLVVPIIYFNGEYFISGYTEQGPGHVEKLFYMTLAITYLSYIFSLLFGTPLVVLLHRFGKLTASNCLKWALVLGAIAGVALGVYVHTITLRDFWGFALFAVAGGVCGLLVSIVFCAIARVPRASEKSL
jgi:hypothetical protein